MLKYKKKTCTQVYRVRTQCTAYKCKSKTKMNNLVRCKRIKFQALPSQLKNSSCTNRWMKSSNMFKKERAALTPGSHVSCLQNILFGAISASLHLNSRLTEHQSHNEWKNSFTVEQENSQNRKLYNICGCTRHSSTCVTPCEYTDWNDFKRSMHFQNVHIFQMKFEYSMQATVNRSMCSSRSC